MKKPYIPLGCDQQGRLPRPEPTVTRPPVTDDEKEIDALPGAVYDEIVFMASVLAAFLSFCALVYVVI